MVERTQQDRELDTFWSLASRRLRLPGVPTYTGVNPLGLLRPTSWAFGSTPEQADRLLALVLDGTKTATASAHSDYLSAGEPLPEAGDLGIVLDGAGHPRALVQTTHVRVIPFEDVDEDHAHAEGEGDRSLRYWRLAHEHYFEAHAAGGYRPDMPVVLERLRVVYP